MSAKSTKRLKGKEVHFSWNRKRGLACPVFTLSGCPGGSSKKPAPSELPLKELLPAGPSSTPSLERRRCCRPGSKVSPAVKCSPSRLVKSLATSTTAAAAARSAVEVEWFSQTLSLKLRAQTVRFLRAASRASVLVAFESGLPFCWSASSAQTASAIKPTLRSERCRGSVVREPPAARLRQKGGGRVGGGVGGGGARVGAGVVGAEGAAVAAAVAGAVASPLRIASRAPASFLKASSAPASLHLSGCSKRAHCL